MDKKEVISNQLITDDVESGTTNNLQMEDIDIDENQVINKLNQKKAPVRLDYRKVNVPINRMKALKENWPTIVKALVEHMKIQVKMNVKNRCVEMRTAEQTEETSAIQKSEEFMKAYMCGFDLQDAIAMLRLEDLYLESFEVKDVKNLQGDHLSRCIGRICGEKGKTKYAIENATRTRIIVQDSKIHILGSTSSTTLARNAICSLILGAPPGKVYSQLRIIGKKLKDNI